MPREFAPAEAAQADACRSDPDRAKALQARRMEIVGRLTGGVVHDFNNILTVIIGTIEILAEAVADRPELAAIAELAAGAAARGANLTSHLLSFARGQPSQPRDVDVNALLAEAARLLRPVLGEHIDIDFIPAIGVSPARVDPSQLMTAILNLAIMARDAMPGGGKLSFALRGPVSGERRADGDAPAAGNLVVAVIASGHGIPADDQERIFAELGVVPDVVRQCGGHIEVRSEADRGSSAEIHLPGAANSAASPAQDLGNACIAGGEETILIVEDDALLRKSVVIQVQRLGYRALVAANTSEALAIIDGREKIDLLFTDVVMPGPISGWQLAVEALSRRPSLRTLYTSGYSENMMVHDGRPDAGMLWLAKPYRNAELAKMIRTALAA
jgi:CheY-like chemotaxis protein